MYVIVSLESIKVSYANETDKPAATALNKKFTQFLPQLYPKRVWGKSKDCNACIMTL